MRTLHPLLAPALALAVLLAGCATPEPETDDGPGHRADAPAASPSRVQPDNPPAADAEETLPSEATGLPLWRVGDWWRWRVETQDSDPFEVASVVAEASDGAYLVGVDALAEGLHAYADHVVALGRIDAATLAWEVHDAPARVLAFPLGDGASWEGTEEGRAMRFVANATRARLPGAGEVDAFDAVGRTPDGPGVSFTWAPEARNFLRYAVHYGDEEPYASATLVAFGTGASSAFVLESDDGPSAFASLPRPTDPEPPMPPQEFDGPSGVTHVLVACVAGGQGAQRAALVPPGGGAAPAFCERASPAEPGNASFSMGLVPAAAPGKWTLAAHAAGGYVEAETYLLRLEERSW